MKAKFASLSSSSLISSKPLEEEDPTSGLANLADCMLVLACGLMVALVVHWNIDINVTEVVQTDEMREVSDLENIDEQLDSGASSFTDLGRVYQDPETGKLYMVEDSE